MIVNVNIGMLEKSTNKSQKSLDFESLTEAVYYQNLMGGRINKVSGFYEGEELVEMTDEYIKELEEEEGKEIKEWKAYNQDWGEYRFDGYTVGHYKIKDGKYYDVINVEKETDKKYYTLTVGDKKEMTNGFRYIKELVLQRHNFKMYQDYYKLMKNDVKVYSVKTDAFIIDKKDVKKAKKLINFSKDIGGGGQKMISKYRHQATITKSNLTKYQQYQFIKMKDYLHRMSMTHKAFVRTLLVVIQFL